MKHVSMLLCAAALTVATGCHNSSAPADSPATQPGATHTATSPGATTVHLAVDHMT